MTIVVVDALKAIKVDESDAESTSVFIDN